MLKPNVHLPHHLHIHGAMRSCLGGCLERIKLLISSFLNILTIGGFLMAGVRSFAHHTLKEIYEGSTTVRETLRFEEKNLIKVSEGVASRARRLIYLTGCGTSYHAGVAGGYALAKLLENPVMPMQASEFVYSTASSIGRDDLVIAFSQSGETTDTLKVVRFSRGRGAEVLGVTNTPGSTLAREADYVVYTHAGPEISVVATKTYLAQLASIYGLGINIAERLRGSPILEEGVRLFSQLLKTSDILEACIEGWDAAVKGVAECYLDVEDAFTMGFGPGYAVALEGALKLKEGALIHAEAYSIAEFRHGPISLLTDKTLVLMVMPSLKERDKHSFSIKLAKEVKEKNSPLIIVTCKEDSEAMDVADHSILTVDVNEILSPIVNIVPCQLLAYHLAVGKGLNPDKPRYLVKVVKTA